MAPGTRQALLVVEEFLTARRGPVPAHGKVAIFAKLARGLRGRSLSGRFCCVTADHKGQGRAETPAGFEACEEHFLVQVPDGLTTETKLLQFVCLLRRMEFQPSTPLRSHRREQRLDVADAVGPADARASDHGGDVVRD